MLASARLLPRTRTPAAAVEIAAASAAALSRGVNSAWLVGGAAALGWLARSVG